MKTKTIVLTAIIIAAILFIWKKAKAATGGAAFKLAKAQWRAKIFTFTHPQLGSYTISNPQGQEGSYVKLQHSPELELGYTRVPGNKIVVTLLHKTGSVFSEVYVLDLTANKATYYSELNPVTVTA